MNLKMFNIFLQTLKELNEIKSNLCYNITMATRNQKDNTNNIVQVNKQIKTHKT